MRPFETLGTTFTPDGRTLTLNHRDGDFFLYLDGEELMSSRAPGSEIALAELALAELGFGKGGDKGRAVARPADLRILIGGLGLGYTLRAALELLSSGSEIVVAELLPAVVEWNRKELTSLGSPLADRRVRVEQRDVVELISEGREMRFDAVLLDVDNGPSAWCLEENSRLYGRDGIRRIREALVPGGVLGVWSAYRDTRFVESLGKAGFKARAVMVRARGEKGARHVVFLGRRVEGRGGKRRR